uniref:Uncharacterized protein n=1 Tax=Entomoneis paludosa TaxID=265537 RepID=A0A7S2YL34_9STRA
MCRAESNMLTMKDACMRNRLEDKTSALLTLVSVGKPNKALDWGFSIKRLQSWKSKQTKIVGEKRPDIGYESPPNETINNLRSSQNGSNRLFKVGHAMRFFPTFQNTGNGSVVQGSRASAWG